MALSTAALLGTAAMHSATSGGTSSGGSQQRASSFSNTYGTDASLRAQQAATSANTAANAAWEKAAAFNAEEARKTREWNERMANTVYQRTVKDMLAAGINPILAANMGLGTASVSSGAQATMGNPQSYMASTFADSQSASQSSGSSWNESLSGLAYLADAIGGAIEKITGSQKIEIAIDGLLKAAGKDINKDGTTKTDEKVANVVSNFTNKTPLEIVDMFMSESSPKREAIYNGKNKNVPGYKNYPPYQYHNNGL